MPNSVESWFLRNAGVPVVRGDLAALAGRRGVRRDRVWLVLFVLETATESADCCGLLYPRSSYRRGLRAGSTVVGSW